LYPKPLLSPSKAKVYQFQSKYRSRPKENSSNNNCWIQTTGKFIVIDSNGGTLLTFHRSTTNDHIYINQPQPTTDIFQNIFKGLGKMRDVQIKLHIDSKIPPIQQPVRHVPWHTRQKVEKELTCLQELDIIKKVSEPTTWLIRRCTKEIRRSNPSLSWQANKDIQYPSLKRYF